MQSFWFVPTQQMWRADFEYLNKEPLAVKLNIDASSKEIDPMVQVGPWHHQPLLCLPTPAAIMRTAFTLPY